jgi:hypothetical protein
MFIELLKAVAWTLGIIIALMLWLVPDPIGKIIEIWRFFRGEHLD